MSTNSQFLSHLQHSSEMIKDWPTWKTGMWQTEENEPNKALSTSHQILQQLFYWPRPTKK